MIFTPEIIKKLPKAELHCHLDGSLRIDTILRLALEQDLREFLGDDEYERNRQEIQRIFRIS